jgi:hypothetical protein
MAFLRKVVQLPNSSMIGCLQWSATAHTRSSKIDRSCGRSGGRHYTTGRTGRRRCNRHICCCCCTAGCRRLLRLNTSSRLSKTSGCLLLRKCI